jgi:hypothetical protein
VKFLNKIDGASKLLTDPTHRLVTDDDIDYWDGKADANHQHNAGDIASLNETISNIIAEALPESSVKEADTVDGYHLDQDVRKNASPTFANIQVPSFENLKVNGSLNNKVIAPDTNQIAQAPIAPFLWHDILAFCRTATPTFERSTDGSSWTSATLNKELFSQKENQAITVLSASNTKAVRWTWNDSQIAWSNISWIVLGITYVPTAPNITVLIESSADGTNWTTRHQSTYTKSSAPMWHYINSLGGDSRLRITITHNSGGDVKLSSIRALTARWGDQGQGRELAFPYDWDENMNMTVLGQTLKVGGKIVATTDQIPSKTSQLTNDSGFLTELPSHKHSVSDVYSLGETISDTVVSVMQSHQSASVPHIYGGKFKWEFNSSTNSLDLVVI